MNVLRLVFVIAINVAIWGGFAWSVWVCAQKGKGRLALFGVLGFWTVVMVFAVYAGAIRLARPNSRWAAERYDAEKTARAEARFADDPGIAVERQYAVDVNNAWAEVDVDQDDLDPITRRALRKAGRLQ